MYNITLCVYVCVLYIWKLAMVYLYLPVLNEYMLKKDTDMFQIKKKLLLFCVALTCVMGIMAKCRIITIL